jgi:hypothetical protein
MQLRARCDRFRQFELPGVDALQRRVIMRAARRPSAGVPSALKC